MFKEWMAWRQERGTQIQYRRKQFEIVKKRVLDWASPLVDTTDPVTNRPVMSRLGETDIPASAGKGLDPVLAFETCTEMILVFGVAIHILMPAIVLQAFKKTVKDDGLHLESKLQLSAIEVQEVGGNVVTLTVHGTPGATRTIRLEDALADLENAAFVIVK